MDRPASAFNATATQALRVAVLVPCFNEEAAIATVVGDFRKALPAAEIFVYDNNSRDRTVEVARAAWQLDLKPADLAGVKHWFASYTDWMTSHPYGIAERDARARDMWCGACSPTSRPTSTCWSTATPPMMRRARRA